MGWLQSVEDNKRGRGMAGRRVLITGAGSGLGLALAKRYAAAGDRVAVVDIVAERAEAAADALAGGGHLAMAADVGSDESMQALADFVRAEWGGLDVLVNNAGVASGGPLVDAPMEEWRWMLEINLLGVVRGCRLFVPGMLAAGRGQIINVASFAGLAGAPGIMSYGVAKAGVVALSEQLRAEVHARGVRVAVVCPSFFRTNLTENFRGSPKMLNVANRLMDSARESADDIAASVHRQAEAGTFLILPTRAEVLRWRLKRWLPEYYFRKLLQMAAGATRTEAA
jgi:NAD(P)-dependent dehydrogenase (short-subunit alcohol dehydrogenase family)